VFAPLPENGEREHADYNLCGGHNETVDPDSGERRKKPGGDEGPEDKDNQGEKDPFRQAPVDAEAEVDRNAHEDYDDGQEVPQRGKGHQRGQQGYKFVYKGETSIGKKQDQEKVSKDSHWLFPRIIHMNSTSASRAEQPATAKLILSQGLISPVAMERF
jgi:hypothetical protein